jgi:hypothetical protein
MSPEERAAYEALANAARAFCGGCTDLAFHSSVTRKAFVELRDALKLLPRVDQDRTRSRVSYVPPRLPRVRRQSEGDSGK